MAFLFLLGRLLFAAMFIVSGLTNHFRPETVQYARSAGVPAPEILVPLSGVIAVLGGLMLLLGIKPRVGAWLLFIFLVPVTFLMHRFWGVSDPQIAQMQLVNFEKNISMIGATLMFQMIDRWPAAITHDTRHWVDTGVPGREAHGHA